MVLRTVHFGVYKLLTAMLHWEMWLVTGTILLLLSFTAKYACIRGDLVREGVLNDAPVWTDRGSGAKMDVSIWKVDGDGLCGFFKAQAGYDKPAYKVFVLPAAVSC